MVHYMEEVRLYFIQENFSLCREKLENVLWA